MGRSAKQCGPSCAGPVHDMLEDPPTSAVIALFEQARSGDASALANVFPLVYTETEALGIGLRTAKRDWAKARSWLFQELYPDAVAPRLAAN